ncbi:hypothetical protein O181_049289 [Austropuccinia psidii MF-1]|uniref:Integrase zinc-binding domain-containing protein n=1 Tax=Austropuccinia psidii MF-1 TaxID=1389203 RepID=A0A9Q3HNN2_9BASI|nr:hypothetical protein [Austropuccinia psidii MF-1]
MTAPSQDTNLRTEKGEMQDLYMVANVAKDVSEYFKACERCKKLNKPIGRRLGNIIQIQEPGRPWESVHMHWVTGLPPGGDKH